MKVLDPETILDFWFGTDFGSVEGYEARRALWFAQCDDFDREIADRFAELPERARRGELDSWVEAERSALALVLSLDQFPRNLHRGDARAFAYDARALDVALQAIDRGFDQSLHPVQAAFLYLPLEHAEDLALQERCVALLEQLMVRAPGLLQPGLRKSVAYAERHRDVIARFGRFPHRNVVLGRRSSSEERAYLEAGGETFA